MQRLGTSPSSAPLQPRDASIASLRVLHCEMEMALSCKSDMRINGMHVDQALFRV